MNGTGKLAILALALLGSVSGSRAGEVYGKITQPGAPVKEGATVSAVCGSTQVPAVKTDATGSYYLSIKETGKCTLTVAYQGQSAELAIASYADGVQVDLVLEVKEGKLTVRRK